MSKTLIVWIASFFSPLASPQTAVTAMLSGNVVSSTGQPVSGAVVTASRTSAPWTTVRANSAADGSFGFSNLAQGTYQFCVQVPGGGYLNTCSWLLAPPPTATVTSSGSVTGLQLSIPVGSLLQIQINDPNNIGAVAGTHTAPAQLQIGVHTIQGLFEPTIFLNTDATGAYHYQTTIPFDAQVSVEILSGKLQVAQSDGTEVASPIGVLHSSTAAGTPPALVLQVTGAKP